MKYKTFDCHSYKIHTIKTDKFKLCHMEIVFRKTLTKEDFSNYTLLCDMLTENSKIYPTRRDNVLKLEDLYRAFFYGMASKNGDTLITNFVYDFISPKFINEDSYLEDVLKYPFDMIENPNVKNDEFEKKTFNLLKKKLIKDLNSVKENSFKLSLYNAFSAMDENSKTSLQLLNCRDEIEKITPSSLFKSYKNFFKENQCDIFIIGDLDMEKVEEIISRCFHHRIINKDKLNLYITNNERKKPLLVSEASKFVQTNMIFIYNILNLTKYEKEIVFIVFNYILGSGGITSKLYQEIREKNSYCYQVDSMFFKYDQLLVIYTSLDKNNKKNTIKMVKKNIKDMQDGKFSDEDLETAKNNLKISLNMSSDNAINLINNLEFKVFDDLTDIEKRKELLGNVTKEEVMEVARKLKLNTIYSLDGGEDNE